jgi:hypothetical protein
MSFYFQNRLRRRSQRLLDIAMDRPNIEALLHCGIYGLDDALLLAGTAASLAGTGASIAASQESASAMNQQRSIEVKRQSVLQDQANQVFRKSLSTSGADTAKQQINTGAAQRQSIADAIKQVGQPDAASAAPTDNNPDTVVDSDGATRTANTLAATRGGAWSTLTSNAATREGGYQDQTSDQALNNADANRNLGVINNRARGWAGLFPLELSVASHKGDALAGWGQLVSALGSASSVAGASGAFAGNIAPPTMKEMNAAAGPVIDTGDASQNPNWDLKNTV